MSNIVRMGIAESQMMEPDIYSNAEFLPYSKVDIEATTYGCTGCGLVWDRKWYAETCEEREHSSSWEQKYGGRLENDKLVGYTAYTRRAIGEDSSIVEKSIEEYAQLIAEILTGERN